jgi:hypothetical protein
MSPAQKLLIDGVRIVMQVLVDEFGDRMTRERERTFSSGTTAATRCSERVSMSKLAIALVTTVALMSSARRLVRNLCEVPPSPSTQAAP